QLPRAPRAVRCTECARRPGGARVAPTYGRRLSGARQAGGTADALHRLHRCADPVHVPLPLAAARGRGADGAIRGGGTGRGGRSVDDRRASTRPTLTATVPVLLLPAHPVGRKCPLGNVEAAMTTEAAPLKSARARWLL